MEERNYVVYCHTSKTTGKKYVGITCQDLSVRFQNGGGYRNCRCFYNAIKRYGWGDFTHEILFSGLDKQDAERMEQDLIASLCTIRPGGYNIETGGNACKRLSEETKNLIRLKELNKEISAECRMKMSASHKGKVFSETHRNKIRDAQRKNFKPVINLDTGEIFESVNAAARSLEIKTNKNIKSVCGGIRDVCLGRRQRAYGYRWRYKE